MSALKDTIIEYARDLFLEVDDNGKKKHTFEFISESIQKKFKKAAHYSTIAKWSVRYDWGLLFEKIKMAGIERATQTPQQRENSIIDEKSQVIADIYKSNKQLQSISKNTLMARATGQPLKDGNGNEIKTDMNNADLIRILQHAENTILLLHDKGLEKEKAYREKLTIKLGDTELEI